MLKFDIKPHWFIKNKKPHCIAMVLKINWVSLLNKDSYD